MTIQNTRLIIADDHLLVADGIANLLQQESGIEIVGTAANGTEALELLKREQVDIALLDIEMGTVSGIEVARKIKENRMCTKVLIVSMHSKREYLDELIDLDVEGYILKGTPKQELLEAIRALMKGDRYYSKQLYDMLLQARQRTLKKAKKIQKVVLTEREQEITTLLSRSRTARQIADKLSISIYTAETHRKNIYVKLGIKSNAELVRYAIKHGLD